MDVDWVDVLQAVHLVYGIFLGVPQGDFSLPTEIGSSPKAELSLGSSKLPESQISKGI